MLDKMNSYSSADGIPIKLIKNTKLINIISTRKVIPPIHAQFIPTNKCNMNCDFCSCSKEDRNSEMSIADAQYIINQLNELGCKSVTITGGGEPLLYSDILKLVWLFFFAGIQIGLVTNGLLLQENQEVLKCITWCRISNSDKRDFNDAYAKTLSEVAQKHCHVDWAFSHVVSTKPNIDEIKKIIVFANEHDFTHVRLVADLINPELVPMEFLKKCLRVSGIDDRKVIYQARNEPVHGGDCYICYLKPVIGADCKVYACCGAQYSLKNPSRRLPQELCLGSAFDLEKIVMNSAHSFNGHICYRCYYNSYNVILKGLLSDTEHERFV